MPRDTETDGLAVLPDDGIGPEVVAATVPTLRAARESDGHRLDVTDLDRGGERFLREGAAMPSDVADLVEPSDAALSGTVRRPDVPGHELIRGRINDLRSRLRPRREHPPGARVPRHSHQGVRHRRRGSGDRPGDTEGEYVGAGGVGHADSGHDLGLELAARSRRAIERAAHQACAPAGRRSGRLCLVTKSNAMRCPE
ncbi:isocitrate/isopropylmalate family dehydrogenase [Streptomyces sp. NPDC056002]|uniref:isocitrate/isopropylmalate family dehydrogenase n=1 Tax=Streptomyces sp. NPDC056002 TaxID=3345675 RepID=UPI0035DF1DB4